MRPYGMNRYDHGDADIAGCRCNGHATAVYALRGPGGDLTVTGAATPPGETSPMLYAGGRALLGAVNLT